MSHEFKVVLDGIDLEDDQVKQLDTAVQQAVLQSLATLDVPCGLGVEFPCKGGPRGIIIKPNPFTHGPGEAGGPSELGDAGSPPSRGDER